MKQVEHEQVRDEEGDRSTAMERHPIAHHRAVDRVEQQRSRRACREKSQWAGSSNASDAADRRGIGRSTNHASSRHSERQQQRRAHARVSSTRSRRPCAGGRPPVTRVGGGRSSPNAVCLRAASTSALTRGRETVHLPSSCTCCASGVRLFHLMVLERGQQAERVNLSPAATARDRAEVETGQPAGGRHHGHVLPMPIFCSSRSRRRPRELRAGRGHRLGCRAALGHGEWSCGRRPR